MYRVILIPFNNETFKRFFRMSRVHYIGTLVDEVLRSWENLL